MDKFDFEGNSFFMIEIGDLKGGVPLSFPLFLYMKMNAVMILRYSIGQTPTQFELERYGRKGLQSFACPEKHHPDFLNYLSASTAAQNPEAPPASTTTVAASAPLQPTPEVTPDAALHTVAPVEMVQEQNPAVTNEPKSEQAPTTVPLPLSPVDSKVLQEMTMDEKKARMQAMGQRMLKSLVEIASGDQRQKWEALRDCQQITQSIVQIGINAYKNKTIYDDLLALSGPEIEHSTAVATISTIFAMISGYFNETELADLSMSGLLHDIGLALIPPEIVNKPMNSWNDRDFKILREHPLEGAQIIEEFGAELSPLVKLVIFQHHERFDGSGYPKKLRGIQIDERVQIVHLADLVADYMRGNVTGKEMNPEQAFKLIKANQLDRGEQYISYELFEPIQQVTLKGKNTVAEASPLQKTGS